MSTFNDLLTELHVTSNDRDIALLVRYVSENSLDRQGVASLARKLAEAGSSLPASENPTADVPSTGGPSSLSTLISPLFLRLKGFTVPKLAVPGRPAGGIDVLATIPGYKASLNLDEVLKCLEACQYSHFLAGGDFVPLDARMFRIRQEIGKQSNPYLVAASLISKKLAASVSHVRLDVRVGPHGNFGRTLKDARGNAKMFNGVARILGLDSGCYLTNAGSIYQPFIGRGESLVALDDLFNDNASSWLREHAQDCWEMTESLKVGGHSPDGSALREVFADNLASQGSSIGEFERRVTEVRNSCKTTIRAGSSGYMQVDINGLRHLLVQAQAGLRSEYVPFPDPCGVELLYRPGQKVDSNQPIAKVRGIDVLSEAAEASNYSIEGVISVTPSAESGIHSTAQFDPVWVIGSEL